MEYLTAFITGGFLCLIGQILLDKTKLTPARILVTYVVLGVVLGGLGIYEYLVQFGGAGATVPLTGFGYSLAKGVKEAVAADGHHRRFHRRRGACCWRHHSSDCLWLAGCAAVSSKG